MMVATSNGCTWWDAIELSRYSMTEICCPHCGSEALVYGGEHEWWDSVRRYADTNPGYEELVAFAKGRCFGSYDEVAEVFERLQHPVSHPQPERGAS